MDEKKDVLLEFYTDWCGPCKVFRPTSEIIAKVYASDQELKGKVTIATKNLEKNDSPDRDVRGVPWFKLFPAYTKDSPMVFAGPRTLECMVEFVRDYGSHKEFPKVGLVVSKIEDDTKQ